MITKCASDIIVGLLTSGLQRSVSLLFHKVGRLRKVDRAVRGLTTSSDLVRSAVTDFETVLGTYQGRLTEDIDRLIRELE